MKLGVLGPEAYGVRTTAGDLLRWLQANMGMLDLDPTLQRAITDTHTGYYRTAPMTQDLIWEQYAYPVTLEQLQAGNSAKMLLQANPARALEPPLAAERRHLAQQDRIDERVLGLRRVRSRKEARRRGTRQQELPDRSARGSRLRDPRRIKDHYWLDFWSIQRIERSVATIARALATLPKDRPAAYVACVADPRHA